MPHSRASRRLRLHRPAAPRALLRASRHGQSQVPPSAPSRPRGLRQRRRARQPRRCQLGHTVPLRPLRQAAALVPFRLRRCQGCPRRLPPTPCPCARASPRCRRHRPLRLNPKESSPSLPLGSLKAARSRTCRPQAPWGRPCPSPCPSLGRARRRLMAATCPLWLWGPRPGLEASWLHQDPKPTHSSGQGPPWSPLCPQALWARP